MEWSDPDISAQCSMLNYDMFDWRHVNEFYLTDDFEIKSQSNWILCLFRLSNFALSKAYYFELNPKSKYLHCPIWPLPNYDIDIFEVNDAQVPASSNSKMYSFFLQLINQFYETVAQRSSRLSNTFNFWIFDTVLVLGPFQAVSFSRFDLSAPWYQLHKFQWKCIRNQLQCLPHHSSVKFHRPIPITKHQYMHITSICIHVFILFPEIFSPCTRYSTIDKSMIKIHIDLRTPCIVYDAIRQKCIIDRNERMSLEFNWCFNVCSIKMNDQRARERIETDECYRDVVFRQEFQ